MNDQSVDANFLYRFGNAARHAIGVGDLIINKHIDPSAVKGAMLTHEPESWVSGAAKAIATWSPTPWNENIEDSRVDIANNNYAADKAKQFKDFDSFSREMLRNSWESATKGTGKVGVPLGTN